VAVTQAKTRPPPWHCCEAATSETFQLLGTAGAPAFAALPTRRTVLTSSFQFAEQAEAVHNLMKKYADVPMSFADACLVRMTEVASEPLLLTTDSDFRI
jgi:predicted nucleic acid-binding protein